MSKLILLLFLVLMLQPSTSKAQVDASDCKKFRTGTFSLQDDSLGSSYIIKRTKKYQQETIVGSNKTVRLKIKWLDDCRYELWSDKMADPADKDLAGVKLIVEILSVTGNTYKCRSTLEGKDFVVEQVLIKIQ